MRFRTYFIAFDFLLSFLGERNCAHYIISVFAVWVVRHPCIEIKKKPLTRSNKTKPFRHRDENPKSKRIRWREEKMIIKQQKGDVVLFKFKFKYLISGYKCFILLFFVLIFLAWFIANKGLPHHYCCCLLFFFLFRFSAFFGRGGGRWAGARKPQSRTREWQWMETKELTASYSLQCIRAMTAYFQQQQQQKKKNDAQEKNVFFSPLPSIQPADAHSLRTRAQISQLLLYPPSGWLLLVSGHTADNSVWCWKNWVWQTKKKKQNKNKKN